MPFCVCFFYLYELWDSLKNKRKIQEIWNIILYIIWKLYWICASDDWSLAGLQWWKAALNPKLQLPVPLLILPEHIYYFYVLFNTHRKQKHVICTKKINIDENKLTIHFRPMEHTKKKNTKHLSFHFIKHIYSGNIYIRKLVSPSEFFHIRPYIPQMAI